MSRVTLYYVVAGPIVVEPSLRYFNIVKSRARRVNFQKKKEIPSLDSHGIASEGTCVKRHQSSDVPRDTHIKSICL